MIAKFKIDLSNFSMQLVMVSMLGSYSVADDSFERERFAESGVLGSDCLALQAACHHMIV